MDDPIACPMPCETCQEPGDCEDCLDCLLWPASPDDDEGPPRAPRGYTVPLPTEAVDGARARVTTGTRVGLVLRRHRRERSISQRALADDLGWSRSMVGRAEVDASALSLATIERALARTGHRIAIVPDGPGSPDEITDDRWGVPEMVARNGAGRRLPPYADAIYRTEAERIQDEGLVGHRQPWAWQHPRA